MEAPWGDPKTCIFVPLGVSLVEHHPVGGRSIYLVLSCEEQLGNDMWMSTEALDAALISIWRR